MANEWRAFERVGEKIGLSNDNLRTFTEVSKAAFREQWKVSGSDYDSMQDYFLFLEEEVFPQAEVIEALEEMDVDSSIVRKLEASNFSVADSFEEYHKFTYSLDQIVDFIMMLKLVKDYCKITGEDSISPRNRLHYLVYLVNRELAEEPDYSVSQESVGLGMLEKTGYRYTFRKRSTGPHSTRLLRDKDRLFAWNILDEEISSEYSDKYVPFEVSLGSTGDTLYERNRTKFNSFRRANSDFLREWHFKQEDVLDEYAKLDIEELRQRIQSTEEYNSKSDGEVLLAGRAQFFSSNSQVISEIAEEVRNA